MINRDNNSVLANAPTAPSAAAPTTPAAAAPAAPAAAAPTTPTPTPTPTPPTLAEQIEQTKERIMSTLLEIDDIQLQQNPRLEAEYSMKIGYLENDLAAAYLAMRRAKRRAELAQAIANRGERLGDSARKLLEATLDREFAQWQADVDETFERALQLIERRRTSRPLTREEARELKHLYRAICKRLHPDINHEPTTRDLTLLEIAKRAYAEGDLPTLRSIDLTLSLQPSEPERDYTRLPDAELNAELAMLEAQLSLHEQELQQLKGLFPYCEREHLADPVWLVQRGEQLRAQIAECREAEEAFNTRYRELAAADEASDTESEDPESEDPEPTEGDR